MLPFVIESWIWYGLVVLLVLARLAYRVLHLGSIKRLQIDDALIVLALAFFTTDIVTLNIVAVTNTNLFPPGYDLDDLSSQDISERVYGSKLVLVVEQCQCATVWLTKACLLVLYYRITVACYPVQNLLVKILSAYVAFGFVFMEIFYFGVWCRPFYNYWAVPTPNIQCNAAINHLITNATFNLSSDCLMMFIAIPMFLRSNLPLGRRLALTFVFSLGIFSILCAILNKYYSFTDPFGDLWIYWYTRESSTCMLIANLPFAWGLLRRLLGLSDSSDNTRHSSRPHNVLRGKGLAVLRGLRPSGASRTSPHECSNNLDMSQKQRDEKPNMLPRYSSKESKAPWDDVEIGPFAGGDASGAFQKDARRSSDDDTPSPVMEKAAMVNSAQPLSLDDHSSTSGSSSREMGFLDALHDLR